MLEGAIIAWTIMTLIRVIEFYHQLGLKWRSAFALAIVAPLYVLAVYLLYPHVVVKLFPARIFWSYRPQIQKVYTEQDVKGEPRSFLTINEIDALDEEQRLRTYER